MRRTRSRIAEVTAIFALSLVGMLIPLASGADPGHSFWVTPLRSISALAFLGGVIYLLLSPSPENDQSLANVEPPREPLPDDAGGNSLGDRINASIADSLRYSRILGVLYIELNCFDELVAARGREEAERLMADFATVLQGRVRAYDRVACIERDQFIVAVAHLRDKSDMLSILERLKKSMAGMNLAGAESVIARPIAGYALYPMGGYTGDDLVATARGHAHASVAEDQRRMLQKLVVVVGRTDRQTPPDDRSGTTK